MLNQQDQPFRALKQFTDHVDIVVGQLKALNLELGWSTC